MLSDFYKEKRGDTIWWADDLELLGHFYFTFDKKKIFNLFSDYPFKLTEEQKAVFDKENPYWADFFQDRQKTRKDSVDNFRERRVERIKKHKSALQMDADDEDNGDNGKNHGNTSLPYGIAKKEGIDTEGMTPKEVWDALEGKGYTPEKTFSSLKSGKHISEISGDTGKKKTKTRILHNGGAIKDDHMSEFSNPYVTESDRAWVREASSSWNEYSLRKYGSGDPRRFDNAGKNIRDIVTERFKRRKKNKDLPDYITEPQIEDIYDVLRDIREFGASEEFKKEKLKIDSEIDSERTEHIVQEAMDRFPKDWLDGCSEGVSIHIINDEGRARYGGNGHIFIYAKESSELRRALGDIPEYKNDMQIVNDVAHELGHYVEDKNEPIGEMARRVLKERTDGYDSEPMDEYPTKRDSFFDKYMGKQYPWGSTEITSVLMQKLGNADPLLTISGKVFGDEKDMKSLKYILGMLAEM